ncbi:CMP-sialic acid transporter 4 [Platanthera zijinensis]|uniref:CMP-sialic acid transporter 4 n=1 Tax=Platanthera zijinensis TaxID=2320716 RepID=A0AAP0AU76_9ASPA
MLSGDLQPHPGGLRPPTHGLRPLTHGLRPHTHGLRPCLMHRRGAYDRVENITYSDIEARERKPFLVTTTSSGVILANELDLRKLSMSFDEVILYSFPATFCFIHSLLKSTLFAFMDECNNQSLKILEIISTGVLSRLILKEKIENFPSAPGLVASVTSAVGHRLIDWMRLALRQSYQNKSQLPKTYRCTRAFCRPTRLPKQVLFPYRRKGKGKGKMHHQLLIREPLVVPKLHAASNAYNDIAATGARTPKSLRALASSHSPLWALLAHWLCC